MTEGMFMFFMGTLLGLTVGVGVMGVISLGLFLRQI